jgi:hypothetical protein
MGPGGYKYALKLLLPCFQEGEGTGIPLPSSIGDDGEQVPFLIAKSSQIMLLNLFF